MIKSFDLSETGQYDDALLYKILRKLDPDNYRVTYEMKGFLRSNIDGDNMKELLPGKWLHDEVINAYMYMCEKWDWAMSIKDENHIRSCFMGTSFLSLQKLPKSTLRVRSPYPHVCDSRFIFCPVNVENSHWYLMFACIKENYIRIIDSLPRERKLYSDALKRLRKAIQPFYCEWTKGQNFKPEIRYPNSTDAKQTNLFDCGVYTLMNMELEMKNQHVDHTHNWWFEKYGRDKIAITLLKGHLIDYLI